MKPPEWSTARFPQAGPGWFNGYVGSLYVSLIGGSEATLAGAEAWIDTTIEAVDMTPRDARIACLTLLQDAAWFSALGLREKSDIIARYGNAMNQRREHIRQIIPVTGNVLPSVVTRTVFRTATALSPAPCPQVITATAAESLRKMARFMPALADPAYLDGVRAIVRERVPSLSALVGER